MSNRFAQTPRDGSSKPANPESRAEGIAAKHGSGSPRASVGTEHVIPMGTLKYDGTSVEFDDLLLAHMQIVVIQKLRRQEAFLMTWREPEHLSRGRTGIWLHPAAFLTFHFATSDRPAIDNDWVQLLMESADSPMGMIVTDADGGAAHPSAVNFSV
jgi:hypothetical protein